MGDLPRLAVIEKEVGETPLATLSRFRQTRPELGSVPLTYAGRLDPMAEGKLLVLIGDECKQRGRYDKLDKEYFFEIFLGAKSDTGDVLGLVEFMSNAQAEISEARVKEVVESFVGTHEFAYPLFSSKTVNGKPLFLYAHEGKADEIEIPKRKSTIYKITYEGSRALSSSELIREVCEKINTLKIDSNDTRLGSDFRKDKILARWQTFSDGEEKQIIIRCRAVVSSGTYIRTLAPFIAEKLGTFGLAYSIKRTKIGRYRALIKGLGFWKSSF